MKLKPSLPVAILLLLSCSFQFSFASGGNIMGQVVDTTNNQPLSDQMVVLDCKGNQQVFVTNEHGFYYASNIPAGTYIIAVVNMGTTYKKEIELSTDATREVDFSVGNVFTSDTVFLTFEKDPLINPLEPPTVGNFNHKQIEKMPVVDVHQIADNLAGVEEVGGHYYVHGAREDGLAYYVDGCRSLFEPDIPLCGIDLYRSYLDFIPAKYGDATGGVIVIETRNYFKENR